MNKPETYIENSKLVTRFFGCWPDFHFSEVISIFLDRNYPLIPKILMRFYAFTGTSKVDNNGDPKEKKHCLIDMDFTGVLESEMIHFNNINRLESICFEKKQDVIICTLSPVNGVKAVIIAEKISVRQIRKIQEDPKDMLDRY